MSGGREEIFKEVRILDIHKLMRMFNLKLLKTLPFPDRLLGKVNCTLERFP